MYSNTNYFLPGNIVEQVSGQSYNDSIRENIFEPLGMTHSGRDVEHWKEQGWTEKMRPWKL